jgi:beta-glucosidase/6-phospho-beta-glucosidase/beta-galactosidase
LVQNCASLYLNGAKLPSNFVYGCAVAAYQVEGAWNEDGRGPSIWDTYSHAGRCVLNATGDVADDFYRSYPKDLPMFKDKIGINSFSFSISWTRIFPSGRGKVNEKGIQYYINLLNEVKKNGLKTSCTLFHWDMPQALYDEYKSFLSEKLVDDYVNYVKLVFQRLGDKCDYWITFNEPKTTCSGFGVNPSMAPGFPGPRSEMYRCGHTLLLAHAAAVKEYRKTGLKAPIGIKIDVSRDIPFDKNDKKYRDASDRANDFSIGWFVNPLTRGDYPEAMKSLGDELPKFTAEQSRALKGSMDFMGLDAYTASWAAPTPNCTTKSYNWPLCVDEFKTTSNGSSIGIPTGSSWNYLVAEHAIFGGVQLVSERYGTKVPLWISETGMSVIGETSLSLKDKINDNSRIQWYKQTLKWLKVSLDKGYKVSGFVPWSCMDNFEWGQGYSQRFGVIGIKYDAAGKGSQERFTKNSAGYLKSVFKMGGRI